MKFQPTRLKAVLFDFDGTLTKPGALNFPAFKASIRCPADQPVLEFIENLPNLSQKQTALIELDKFEMAAAENAERPCPCVPTRSVGTRVSYAERGSEEKSVMTPFSSGNEESAKISDDPFFLG